MSEDPLRWGHNGCDSVSNHQPHDCLLNRLFRCRWKKTSKLRVTGLCAGDSPGTGEFPAQMASNAENVSIWWRHHAHRSTSQLWFGQWLGVVRQQAIAGPSYGPDLLPRMMYPYSVTIPHFVKTWHRTSHSCAEIVCTTYLTCCLALQLLIAYHHYLIIDTRPSADTATIEFQSHTHTHIYIYIFNGPCYRAVIAGAMVLVPRHILKGSAAYHIFHLLVHDFQMID